MAYTQEDFQEWIFFISDKLDYMTDTFAKENGLNLDLSVESIDALEEWMLAHYSSPQDLINDPRMRRDLSSSSRWSVVHGSGE